MVQSAETELYGEIPPFSTKRAPFYGDMPLRATMALWATVVTKSGNTILWKAISVCWSLVMTNGEG